MNNALTPAMQEALVAATARFDSHVSADWRTLNGLVRRGYVDLTRGRGTNHLGETVYNMVIAVQINDAGRAAVAS